MAKQKNSIQKSWKRWPYKNTTLLIISFILVYYLAKTPLLDNLIKQVGNLGYFGAFLTGLFFVSTFTVAPAAIVLFHLAESLHPVEVAILAGLGSMLGDYLIFRYVKDEVFDELLPLIRRLGKPYISPLFKSPFFGWLMPVLGAALIASPLPDELGVGMLGLTKIRRWQFFVVTFALNAIGIFIVVTATRL